MLGMWLMVLEWKVNRITKLLKQKEKAYWEKTKMVYKMVYKIVFKIVFNIYKESLK